ncbi:MAG: hypothetical protein K0S32_1966 [Bacteroidetes bacterium]|jgi:hypothetical protein|nr:hypothetical protein [Bacteroidota bacterium]
MISEQLNGLQKLLSDFSTEGVQQKISLLKTLNGTGFKSKKEILQYHNQLLFLLSYTENAEIYSAAEKEMERITQMVSSSEKLKEQLTGSGIAGTAMEGAYSLTLTKWLLKEYKGKVFFHSFDESGTHPKEIFKHVLSDAEFELLSDEKLNAEKWLQKAAGTKDNNRLLEWLVNTVDSINAPDSVKDQLFESLQLFIRIDTYDKTFSRSFGKVPVTKQFFHSDGIIKKFNEREMINKALPAEKKLSEVEKKKIVNASRVALALLIRETDPITYCEELNLKYFELERGLSIALFSIDSERRLPLESYAGFMMFKNGYPMSYGGAWLFGKRSLIGINIFEAFRGGESAIVFAQLCRCYHKAFGATYFEVEPYQFGKDNPEGIQSGAFWFYFRFGFRPVDDKLHKLSLEEQEKISSTKGYRSPVEVLKQFTKSNLFVHFDNDLQKPLNPSDMSRFVSKRIAKDFEGDRTKAQKWCVQHLRGKKIITGKENKTGLAKLGFFLAFCVNVTKLNAKEKSLLSKLVNEKGQSEFRYIELLKGFSFEKHLSEDFKQFLL